MNILQAYNRAREMGRKADKLFLSYDKRLDRQTGIVTVTADVSGGSEPHSCMITYPVKSFTLGTGNYPLDAKRNPNVLMHCDCSDFRFTFFPYINMMGEALEQFPPYIPNGRGQPRAIDGYGMCKHLIALFDSLKKANVIKI